MGWKTIRITKPARISIHNGNLIVKDDETRIAFSLSDTDSIIFEGDRFSLSGKVFAALSKHKVATLFCDEYYMPTAILHPYHQSALATTVLKSQLSTTKAFADLIWAEIIRVKIALQAEVSEHYGGKGEQIRGYIDHIRPGDPYKAEAKSARAYWGELFEKFRRERESFDIRNQAINYAYAILRSLITRDLSAAGFLPALGLWHDNRYNAFNLSDDLIEPFRPIVDAAVVGLLPHFDDEMLTPDFKRAIIAIFDKEYVIFESGLSSLRSVVPRYIQRFKNTVVQNDPQKMVFASIDFGRLDECF
jgi:CRISPR-associated protein Cas1